MIDFNQFMISFVITFQREIVIVSPHHKIMNQSGTILHED